MKINIRKRVYCILMVVVSLTVLVSCGGRKNTAGSRFYHSVNSRYNIYYNGKTSFDEALKSLNNGYKENYTEQIAMFPVSAQYKEEKTATGGPFDRAIEKGRKAIKLHSIQEKPPRKAGWKSDPKQVKLQQQEEFNPFMKHCWLLVGEGQFYNGDFMESAATFSYITRHFATDKNLVAQAQIWQARCYTEMDWFYETNNMLRKLQESGVPVKQQKAYERMYADYLIRSEQIVQAIPYLEKSIKAERNKRQRSRMRYLLGQLYMNLEKNDLAYETFRKLASSSPPYEIEFSARIRQTEVFPGGNDKKVLKMLRRMAKSDKNKDFLDQVYYAMGNVYMTQQDTAKAIECYSEGIEKSTQHGMDKAICQIRLGDLYFAQKDYINAQPCFSGALSGIETDYSDYERVSRLSATLDELVIYYEAVHLQDSLQALSRMPEEERLAVIDKIIEDIIEEEKRAEEEAQKEEYLANQASIGSNLNRGSNMSLPSFSTAGASGDNSFYFYNPQTVAQGKTQFQNKWGKRVLGDDWRRRNKKMTLLADGSSPEELSGMQDGQDALSDSLQLIQDSLASDYKSREYYLQQIPFTEEEIEDSDIIIADGLFNMGMIYKDRLEDMPLSVETFEELERRFPDNKYRMDYYYHIYLMGLRYKDMAYKEKYKNKMLVDFPDSEYATALSDPDYEQNMRMMDNVQDSLYKVTYEHYLAEDIPSVRQNYRNFRSKYPLADLLPKFMFLNALTYVQEGDAEGFKEALTELAGQYPGADVSELANEMLKGLLRGRELKQGSFSSMAWNIRFGTGEDGELSAADSARTFSLEKNTPHRMLFIYTNGTLDKNQLLYTVAAYNFANFRVKGFDISFEDIGTITILTINGFDSFDEIADYYRMIYQPEGYASALDNMGSFFPVSGENYEILMRGKTLEEYMTFFVQHYAAEMPELVNRWSVRLDGAQEEEDGTPEAEEEKDSPTPDEQFTEETEAEKEASVSEPIVIPEKKVEKDTIPLEIPHDELLETEIPEDFEPDSLNLDRIIPEGESEQPQDDPEYVEEERPSAKRQNIFEKLFKRIKETEEFKTIEEGINKVKEAAEDEPADTVAKEKPAERIDGELTLDGLKVIREQEAKEKAEQEAEELLLKEEAQKAAEELKKQQAKDKELQRKQKAKERKERLKQKEKERKEKIKERKQRLKAKEKERREREKERKKALKQKEKERKEKEKARKKALKEKRKEKKKKAK